MKAKQAKVQLTEDQINLAAKYLAMSNMCTLERYRKSITDLPSLKTACQRAWEDAVTGTMESMDGGYDDRNEGKAIRGVTKEIDMFIKDLRGKKRQYWIDELKSEIPFLFENHVKVLHGLCSICGHYGEDCTGKPLQ